MSSLEQSVKANIKFVKESPFIRKELRDSAQGFIFDVKSGEVKKIA
jgi:carbonic anhydrase